MISYPSPNEQTDLNAEQAIAMLDRASCPYDVAEMYVKEAVLEAPIHGPTEYEWTLWDEPFWMESLFQEGPMVCRFRIGGLPDDINARYLAFEPGEPE